MLKKDTFQYAALYQSKTGEYCTDGSLDHLVMGPETEKRFKENDDCAVTICCITYKHEHLIRQALDSFLMQKTNFKFKIFVGEDCGPDHTADVIREYANKYPDIIVPFIREKNMGAQRNLIDLCQHANSPYIAFCEGDDYWIDEYKLQKQFDYMQEHTKVRVCYTRTKILAPENWHLNSYYLHEKDGSIVIPECTPGFEKKEYYNVEDFLKVFPSHTSSAFYRWNYDLDVPEWYYEGLIGDTPITLLQMGLGTAAYLPHITSVYRRSDVGVFMNQNDEEHYINTRLDYVRFLSGIRTYFNEHFGNDWDNMIRNRITREIFNYLNAAKKMQDEKCVIKLFELYPEDGFNALHSFLGSYGIYTSLQAKIPPRPLYNFCQTRRGYLSVYPLIWVYDMIHRSHVFYLKVKNKLGKIVKGIHRYWKNSKVPKQKNLWVFSGFRHNNYMDNCMYFYEYVVNNHPEIEAVWLTTSHSIYAQLQEQGKPVYMMNTPEGQDLLSRAEIAVTDHFVMSDYSPEYGFNDKTKVVQLWHGVGFKSMGDGKGVKNTAEKGVRYSGDILIKDQDNFLVKWFKKIKYYFVAPFREKFEKYFLFLCPGQERIDTMAKVWNIPMDHVFMAGHPRDIPVYHALRQENPVKIMYAPTYRFDVKRETAMVQALLNEAAEVQKLMEEINGEFYLRMHPHTWRNYSTRISKVLDQYDRLFVDGEKDVYPQLGSYSILISDYSSIAMDFALLDRPVIFHTADYDWFIEHEAGFNVDFQDVIPGPMTRCWKDTLEEIKKYHNNPQKDSDLRMEKLKYFFDKSVNGPDNSERIVAEIKRRIGLEG